MAEVQVTNRSERDAIGREPSPAGALRLSPTFPSYLRLKLMFNSPSRRLCRLGLVAFAATLLGLFGAACGGNEGTDSASGGTGPVGGATASGGGGVGGSSPAGGGAATGGRAAGGGSTGGSSAGGNGAGGFQFPGNSEDCPTDAPEDESACTPPDTSASGGGSGFPGGGGLFCLYDGTFCSCSAQSSTWNCFGGNSGGGGEGPGPLPGFGGDNN
jgi:hypothetical protein